MTLPLSLSMAAYPGLQVQDIRELLSSAGCAASSKAIEHLV